MRARIALSLTLLLSGCGAATTEVEHATATGPQTPGELLATLPEEHAPSGQLPDDVTPLRYALDLHIDPAREVFTGTVDVRVRLDHPTQRIWMHGTRMTVQDAWIAPGFEGALDNGPLTARPTSAQDATWAETDVEGVNRITMATPMGPGEVTIHLQYEAPFDHQLKGLYRVDVGDDHYAFTQFEATSARYAFPSFDEPRWKTPFDVRIHAPASMRAFANTHELSTASDEGENTVVFAPTEPLPTYLVAWAVGPLEVVEGAPIAANDVRTTPLPFRGICARGRGAELARAMRDTPALVASLERYTGHAYPYDKLDIVAVPDFASGAMENAGLITFRESLLLMPETPPEDQLRAFTNVMAHELAHQWFGNLVTMPWWDDIWLNEAFATNMASRTVNDVHPEQNASIGEVVSAHNAMGSDALAAARRIRQPIESEDDIRNAFDGITYQKGAAVIAMFERYLGPEVFRQGLHAYLQQHRFGTARAEDLLTVLSQTAQRDVTTPFFTFLNQAGVPLVQADLSCGEGGNVISLTSERFVPLGSGATHEGTWGVPVCVRYGTGAQTSETCTLLSTHTGRIALPAGACPAWIHPNSDARGYYRFALPAEDLQALVSSGYAHLNPRERVSLASNVRAMVAAGTLDIEAALPLYARFASDEERLVAVEPMGGLIGLVDYFVSPEHEARARTWAGSLYATRFRQLGWNARPRESGDERLLRRDLADFMTRTAEDPAAVRAAADMGLAYVGRGRTRRAPTDGALHPEAVNIDLAGIAVMAALAEESPTADALFDHIATLALNSQDAMVRSRLLYALGSVENESRAQRALALTLDSRVRTNELGILMAAQSERQLAGRERALAWLSANLEAVSARMPDARLGALPWTFSGFCSAEARGRVEALFAPHAAEWAGAPRNLAGALEVISMCEARVARQHASADRFVGALPAR